MKVSCKNIPLYDVDKGEWSSKSFEDQYEFGDFLLANCFKEPGEYQFHKDFSIKLWCEKALKYQKDGNYIDYAEGTEEYWNFWDEEEIKSRLGVFWVYQGRWYYTTRDYYFLLNYFKMVNKELGYIETFASPRDVQYHMMLYEKIAECFDLNSSILKRRQMMFSNCHVAKSLNYLFFEHNKRIKWGASDSAFILDPINGSWNMVDIAKAHINQHTGWTKDFSPDKPGSLLQRVQIKDGKDQWRFEGNLSSIVVNTLGKDPAKGVGGPTYMFWYEEGGIAPTAHLTLQFLEPAILSGGKRMGTFIIGGSVGDLKQCKPLEDFTRKPNSYGFLAVPTKWADETGAVRECGLFIPAQYGMPEATDEHGNSLVDVALHILDKSEKEGWKEGEMKGNTLVRKAETAWKELPEEDYTLKKSQNPRTLKEAFAFRGVAKFNIARIEKRQKELQILIEQDKIKHKKGLLYRKSDNSVYLKQLHEMKDNERPKEMEWPVDPTIPDKRGVVTIAEEYNPNCDYYAGVDSIEADVTTTSPSLFSIDIYRRSYVEFDKTTGKQKLIKGKLVAWWRGRFNETDETNEHGMMLLEMYNARTAAERNKPNFIGHCRRNGKGGLIALSKDLPFDKDIDVSGRENGQYGIHRDSGGKVLAELIRVGKEFLNTVMDVIYLNPEHAIDNPDTKLKKTITGYDTIEDYWLLEELKYYNDDGNDNFDRVDSSLYALHYGTAEELSFQNKMIKIESEKTKDDGLFDQLKKPLVKKFGHYVKKFGQNRNLLNY